MFLNIIHLPVLSKNRTMDNVQKYNICTNATVISNILLKTNAKRNCYLGKYDFKLGAQNTENSITCRMPLCKYVTET
jgi:hypothetical protein